MSIAENGFVMPGSKNTIPNPNMGSVVSADVLEGIIFLILLELAQFSDTDIGTLCSRCWDSHVTDQYATYV